MKITAEQWKQAAQAIYPEALYALMQVSNGKRVSVLQRHEAREALVRGLRGCRKALGLPENEIKSGTDFSTLI